MRKLSAEEMKKQFRPDYVAPTDITREMEDGSGVQELVVAAGTRLSYKKAFAKGLVDEEGIPTELGGGGEPADPDEAHNNALIEQRDARHGTVKSVFVPEQLSEEAFATVEDDEKPMLPSDLRKRREQAKSNEEPVEEETDTERAPRRRTQAKSARRVTKKDEE